MPHECTRFWSKVDMRGPDDCWLWTGSRHGQGYGHIRWDGHVRLAHRVMWIITHDTIPDGLDVCHTCDNPPCVNPAHLFLGTHADNMRDMRSKCRHTPLKGESHGNARFTNDDIRTMRTLASQGVKQTAIAAQFGMRQGAVSDIVLRKAWKHIQDTPETLKIER